MLMRFSVRPQAFIRMIVPATATTSPIMTQKATRQLRNSISEVKTRNSPHSPLRSSSSSRPSMKRARLLWVMMCRFGGYGSRQACS